MAGSAVNGRYDWTQEKHDLAVSSLLLDLLVLEGILSFPTVCTVSYRMYCILRYVHCTQNLTVCKVSYCIHSFLLYIQYPTVCTVSYCMFSIQLYVQYPTVYTVSYSIQFPTVCTLSKCIYSILLNVQYQSVCTYSILPYVKYTTCTVSYCMYSFLLTLSTLNIFFLYIHTTKYRIIEYRAWTDLGNFTGGSSFILAREARRKRFGTPRGFRRILGGSNCLQLFS